MKRTKIIIAATALLMSLIGFTQTKNNTTMNLKDLHNDTLGVQTNIMFSTIDGKVISLQILKDSQLKEHITNVPALLICVTGNAIYEDEKGNKATLYSGDFVKIESNVKHWVNGIENSNLLLIK
jgi:mannose-6-phosphate isomerase-like protein (cupin superfamily)